MVLERLLSFSQTSSSSSGSNTGTLIGSLDSDDTAHKSCPLESGAAWLTPFLSTKTLVEEPLAYTVPGSGAWSTVDGKKNTANGDEAFAALDSTGKLAGTPPDGHPCKGCSLRFNDLVSLQSHAFAERHPVFTCPLCTKTDSDRAASFVSSVELRFHLWITHSSTSTDRDSGRFRPRAGAYGIPPIVCWACRRELESLQALEQHDCCVQVAGFSYRCFAGECRVDRTLCGSRSTFVEHLTRSHLPEAGQPDLPVGEH